VIDMAPMGTRHFAAVSRLHRSLTLAVGDRALVNAQLPLRLGAMSEPEPDISVLQPRMDYYAAALPTAADALLVIEVADSTLAFDLHTKARLYASHGVGTYWVFDLPNGLLHVHGAPEGDAYGIVTALRQPGSLPVPGLPGLAIDLTGLL
jgi:hypothetical protein